ncbi:DUF427 domain-containing protein [Burkholderia sp. TSV86]|uniref:DUF427 domain-containing protein n=1 Tax=Burkholderia sp. TSV86 TaxID=1385594 RepID=UPI000759E150|nr:DUF427 domain-containing protein [Burkholderia sp. TSV86]KVE32537.1 hypothetical protein WS68_15440 [Burkholderia sp. TSV86]
MSEHTLAVKIPGPDHPITIEATGARVVVTVNGSPLADTRNALTLREAAYPPVQYIPRDDVDMTRLERSAHASYCPYKGSASYYSVDDGDGRRVDAVWSYELPHDAVKQIAGHLAFYPDRVDSIAIG